MAIRLGAFCALALYGALHWGTLLRPAPTPRLLGLVAVAGALALVGPPLAARSRGLAGGAVILAAVAMLALCGLPVAWVRHVRVTISAREVGDGLAALPRLLVPYVGDSRAVRLVILLGAGVLLFDAAIMLAFASGGARISSAGGDLRRAITALPLVALAGVPLALMPPQLPYVQGLMLFALIAALIWGERVARASRLPAVLVCGLAVAGAMVAAPSLHDSRPWFNYRALPGAAAPGEAVSFDWSQRYGPLNWPREGRQVLTVTAAQGDYWKAVDLDFFDGSGWRIGSPPTAQLAADVSRSARRRWTQTLRVSIGAMSTHEVIGAGEMAKPAGATQLTAAGASPGTWVSVGALAAGDSYTVQSYAPHPSPAQRAAASTRYPGSVLSGDLDLTLPVGTGRSSSGRVTLAFPAFGSAGELALEAAGPRGVTELAGTPYAGVYALAQRLGVGARTPEAYVQRVLAYLHRGFSYYESPPPQAYPLAGFLLRDHRGYCQQFAGAMALLLRMGGVPARVAAGFTPGQLDSTTHRWLVSDTDAHAWVEAFYPGYGWVRLDPTPAADPARGGSSLGVLAPSTARGRPGRGQVDNRHGLITPGELATRAAHGPGGSGLGSDVPVVLAVLAALAVLGAALRRPLRALGPDALLAELERAFARTGRPLTPQVTLSDLERRLHGAPEAEDYVRALRMARFGPGAELPSAAQRRALRLYLRSGLGTSGALHALWALPPRRAGRPRAGRSGGPGGPTLRS